MQVRVKRAFILEGKRVFPGDVLDLPQEKVEYLLGLDRAPVAAIKKRPVKAKAKKINESDT